jgi:hypothetical protein
MCIVIMGSVPGRPARARRQAGLEGWPRLFLAEGSQAVVVGLLFLRLLPDARSAATWLTSDEKD